MGREIKRVPLDFDWDWAASRKPWEGYLMPESLSFPDCETCDGSGSTTALDWLHAVTTLLSCLGDEPNAQERGRRIHPYLTSLMAHPDKRPGPEIVELTAGLAGREPGWIAHDSIDHWNFDKKIIAAAGLPDTWGQCPTCSGRGHLATPEQEAAQEAWERTEPPEGEGYQLWETVSEGSPITPVFATAEELARWMTTHRWGSQTDLMASSFEVAMRFIDAGWAPSGMASAEHGVESGVEAVGRS